MYDRSVRFAFSRRVWAAAGVGLALATVAPAAHADPESDAKDLFAKGRDLREKNDCGTAAPLFRKAWTIYPQALGSLRNLAECEEQLGHFASSRRAWLDLKRSLITNTDPKYNDWDRDAEEAAKRLQPKVASFVIDVIVKSPTGEAPATEKSGIELFVNGEEVKGTLVGTPLERDPGNYLIRAQAKDGQPVEQSVSLNAGDNPHVTLRMTITPPAQPVGPAPEDHSMRRTIGWGVTGLGAALVVASGVTFLMRQGALGDVDDACGGDHEKCDPNARSKISDSVDRGKTMSTLTTILLPAGLVGIGAGLVLVFTSPKVEKTGFKSFQVAPTLGGLSLGGKF